MINAEVTGQFIEVTPRTLDYNACVFNSVYQLCFYVHNKATIPHGIGIKFPLCLREYLSSSVNDVYIQPNEHKCISIKFIPRKEILFKEINYYNPETKILEFPIYVCIMSKKFLKTPPTKVTIFAILTESNGLSLHPEERYHASYINESCEMDIQQCNCEYGANYIIDMGECTTNETVYTELKLINNSFVFQNFGFLNLPESIKLLPNYGFGEIFPMEMQVLTIAFSPEAKDIPNYAMECENANRTVILRISANTLKNIGGIKQKEKPFKYKFIRKSLNIMEKELEKDLAFGLHEDITTCLDLLRDEGIFNALTLEKELELHANMEEADQEQLAPEEELEEPFEIKNNNLWIKATIIDPLCDLSYSYIEFPDTPCGSYSVMGISLRALTKIGDFNCVCGYAKKFSKCTKCINYKAHFEIIGDENQINVEPICGDLQAGQEIKLKLVAKPQLSEARVMETAKEIKREELIQQKRLKWLKEMAAKLEKAQKKKDAKKGKKGGKKDKKEKKGKKDKKEKKSKKGKSESGSEKSSPKTIEPEPEPEFIVDDSEIIIDYYDLYPAEMATWKNMEPYYIEAHFCCTITYTNTNIPRKPEKLYFTASCKVIRPHIIHDLKTQHIDFGPVPIGMAPRKIIGVQNIHYNTIHPTVTLLSPIGSYSCPSIKNLALFPEHILQLPLKFAPTEEKEETEYFEIKAGRTVYPLIVSGEGVECNLAINPNFVVCRLEAKTGAFADCAIEINNQSKGPVIIDLIKICELEGEIKPIEKPPAPKGEKGKKGSAKSKKGSDKSKKGSAKSKKSKGDKKPKKISKFSQTLEEEEEVSLQNYFAPKEGQSYFEVLGGNGNSVEVTAFTKKFVKIHFGVPLPPVEKGQKGKKGKGSSKKGKGSSKKSKGSSKKGKGSSKKSKGSSKKGKKGAGPQKYYVAKFNLMMGNTFLRDAIIIATFV